MKKDQADDEFRRRLPPGFRVGRRDGKNRMTVSDPTGKEVFHAPYSGLADGVINLEAAIAIALEAVQVHTATKSS